MRIHAYTPRQEPLDCARWSLNVKPTGTASPAIAALRIEDAEGSGLYIKKL